MFGVLCQIATERGARCFENVAITATAPEKYTMPNDAAKPDWHDRPTEPGLWVMRRKNVSDTAVEYDPAFQGAKGCRFWGPIHIPPDTKEEK